MRKVVPTHELPIWPSRDRVELIEVVSELAHRRTRSAFEIESVPCLEQPVMIVTKLDGRPQLKLGMGQQPVELGSQEGQLEGGSHSLTLPTHPDDMSFRRVTG